MEDEYCPDCGIYSCTSQVDCNKQHIKNLENSELTEEENNKMIKYCETRCTSSCGKDYDCPHEENFINNLIEDLTQ